MYILTRSHGVTPSPTLDGPDEQVYIETTWMDETHSNQARKDQR